MSSRHLAAATVATFTTVILATPAAARTLAPSADPVSYGWTPDRFWASAAALLALGCVILGAWFLARSTRRTNRKPPLLALAVGLFAALNGVLVVIAADGGPGTGNGIVGGYIAVALGLIAALLNRLALTRTR